MPAYAIVKRFDVLEDFSSCLRTCAEQRLVNELDL